MNIRLIQLHPQKILLQVQIKTQKNSELNDIFIGQKVWNNGKVVGKITKISFLDSSNSQNFQIEKENLVSKNGQEIKENNEQINEQNTDKNENSTQNSTQNLEKFYNYQNLEITAVGNFTNCKWRGRWKIARENLLSPIIWENVDLENENSTKETDKNGKNQDYSNQKIGQTSTQNFNANSTQNSNIKTSSEKFLERFLDQNQNENSEKNPNSNRSQNSNSPKLKAKKEIQKYYFIPTVQKFETVKAGQKLGFVEVCGNLYWLICPNFEMQYQIQIESGEFGIGDQIGILSGKNGDYKLTLEQSLDFNFDLIPRKSNQIISSIALFDLFCPFVLGNKIILNNFSDSFSQIPQLLTSLLVNYPSKPIIITDFDFFAPDFSIFQAANWLDLTKYFALCGNDVIVILENLPEDFAKYLDFFGVFETGSGENCSISFFWHACNSAQRSRKILENDGRQTNQKRNESSENDGENSENQNQIDHKIGQKLKYFDTLWTLQKNTKLTKNSNWQNQNSTPNFAQNSQNSQNNKMGNLDPNNQLNKNNTSNSENWQILPDMKNSFGNLSFKNRLLDNLRQQNSAFVNQNNNRNFFNLENLSVQNLENPFYTLVLTQKTNNLEQSVSLWELFEWLTARFETEIGTGKLTQKIKQNQAKLTQIIQKSLQNQDTTNIKKEISSLLES